MNSLIDKEMDEKIANEIKLNVLESIGPHIGVYFNCMEGSLDEVENELIDKIQSILDEDECLLAKIGKSSNPFDRFQQEYAKQGFTSMEVIYRSRNSVDIEGEDGAAPEDRGAEGKMIENFYNDMKILNIAKGSPGLLDYNSPFHYLYVAIATPPLKSGPFEMFKDKVAKIVEDNKKLIGNALSART